MKGVHKSDLPVKVCVVCKRPFSWRKKWEKCWDEVKYCSDFCRNNKQRQSYEVCGQVLILAVKLLVQQ